MTNKLMILPILFSFCYWIVSPTNQLQKPHGSGTQYKISVIPNISQFINHNDMSINSQAVATKIRIQNKTQSKEDYSNMLQKWRKTLQLLTFESTIDAFPYLKRNMKGTILNQLYMNRACYDESMKLEVTRFAILDNRAYHIGGLPKAKQQIHDRIKLIKNVLDKITLKYQIPDLFFVVTAQDLIPEEYVSDQFKSLCQSLPLFTFNKNITSKFQRKNFLIPDPYVLDQRFYRDVIEIKKTKNNFNWEKKIPIMYFRGAPTSPSLLNLHKIDLKRHNIFKYFHRAAFVLLSLQNPDLIDAKFTANGYLVDLISQMVGKNVTIKVRRVGRDEHFKYRFILTADGYTAGWKRPQWVLYSNSILFKPFSDIIQWFYDKMVPQQHFVLIKQDLSDIFDKFHEFNNNREKSLSMVEKANQMANRLFTKQALQDFIAQTLIKYANIQKLNLTAGQKQKIKKGTDLKNILSRKRMKELIQSDKQYLQKWQQTIKQISFQSTINQNPFFKDNFDAVKLAKMYNSDSWNGRLVAFLILDNKVYIDGNQVSNNSKMLQQAIQSKIQSVAINDMYFVVSLGSGYQEIIKGQQEILNKQCQKYPVLAFNKNVSSVWERNRILIPDLVQFSKWNKTITIVKQQNQKVKWEDKLKKAYFLTDATGKIKISSQTTDKKFEVSPHDNWNQYILLSNQRPDLVSTKFTTSIPRMQGLLNQMENNSNKSIELQNYYSQTLDLNYRYQFTTDKFVSSTQLPKILLSNSLLLKQLSQRVQWFYNKLIPNQHFIPINQDLSDLFTKINNMNIDDTRAKEIIKNANKFAEQNLTEGQISSFFVQVLKKIGSFQKLELNKQVKEKIKNGLGFLEALKFDNESVPKQQMKNLQTFQAPQNNNL